MTLSPASPLASTFQVLSGDFSHEETRTELRGHRKFISQTDRVFLWVRDTLVTWGQGEGKGRKVPVFCTDSCRLKMRGLCSKQETHNANSRAVPRAQASPGGNSEDKLQGLQTSSAQTKPWKPHVHSSASPFQMHTHSAGHIAVHIPSCQPWPRVPQRRVRAVHCKPYLQPSLSGGSPG